MTENSNEFDEILKKKDCEIETNSLSMKLEIENMKGKIIDYEDICDKMDKEINAKTQEIKKKDILLDKNLFQIKELNGKNEILLNEIGLKDKEILELKNQISEILEKSEEKTNEVIKVLEHKEEEIAYFKEDLFKEKENEINYKIHELQQVIFI